MGVKLGQALGQGNAAAAKRICLVSSVLVLGICLAGGLLVMTFSRQIGAIFSADPELLEVQSPSPCGARCQSLP